MYAFIIVSVSLMCNDDFTTVYLDDLSHTQYHHHESYVILPMSRSVTHYRLSKNVDDGWYVFALNHYLLNEKSPFTGDSI